MAQISTPRELYGELFTDVQLNRVFHDSKTFVDCIPKKEPQQILADYKALKNDPKVKFSLRLFVEITTHTNSALTSFKRPHKLAEF